jgi:hypothetical protein
MAVQKILVLVALLGFAADEPAARAVLWRDSGPIAAKDLYWGPGKAESAPTAPFTFVSEDTGGTKPKIEITDANGVLWNVKFAGTSKAKNEVHAEIAATRLAWALGYFVEEHYFVRGGTIDNVPALERAARSVSPDGTFGIARFERRDAQVERTGRNWSLHDNPFEDTRELSGFHILVALLNNWDVRSSNTNVLRARGPDGRPEDRFVVSDYGATFGRMGRPALFTRWNRWSLEDYEREPFVTKVDDEHVYLHYEGYHHIERVPLEHARWFSELASALTDDQIKQAFEASGASAQEVSGFSARLQEKLAELRAAVARR